MTTDALKPALGVTVKEVVNPCVTVCGALGLMVPLLSAKGVTVQVWVLAEQLAAILPLPGGHRRCLTSPHAVTVRPPSGNHRRAVQFFLSTDHMTIKKILDNIKDVVDNNNCCCYQRLLFITVAVSYSCYCQLVYTF